MPYVQRDESGAVTGLFANPQEWLAPEYLAEDDAAVVDFLAPPAPVGEIAMVGAAEGVKEIDAPSLQDQITALAGRIASLEAKAG